MQFLINRNGVSVEGSSHQAVVDLIKQNNQQCELLLLPVTDDEAKRLDSRSKGLSHHGYIPDYTEKNALPITVPDWTCVDQNGERYTVSFILMIYINEFVIYNLIHC